MLRLPAVRNTFLPTQTSHSSYHRFSSKLPPIGRRVDGHGRLTLSKLSKTSRSNSTTTIQILPTKIITNAARQSISNFDVGTALGNATWGSLGKERRFMREGLPSKLSAGSRSHHVQRRGFPALVSALNLAARLAFIPCAEPGGRPGPRVRRTASALGHISTPPPYSSGAVRLRQGPADPAGVRGPGYFATNLSCARLPLPKRATTVRAEAFNVFTARIRHPGAAWGPNSA